MQPTVPAIRELSIWVKLLGALSCAMFLPSENIIRIMICVRLVALAAMKSFIKKLPMLVLSRMEAHGGNWAGGLFLREYIYSSLYIKKFSILLFSDLSQSCLWQRRAVDREVELA
jgi:hypothetical protein